MSEIAVIALDAMGGDNAPGGEMVKGAVDALGREQDEVYLLGKEDIVNASAEVYL